MSLESPNFNQPPRRELVEKLYEPPLLSDVEPKNVPLNPTFERAFMDKKLEDLANRMFTIRGIVDLPRGRMVRMYEGQSEKPMIISLGELGEPEKFRDLKIGDSLFFSPKTEEEVVEGSDEIFDHFIPIVFRAKVDGRA